MRLRADGRNELAVNGEIAKRPDANCCAPGAGSTCGGGASERARRAGYEPDDLSGVPEGANLGLGCGAPVGHLDPQPGETVLDLGSGGGLDAFVAAHRVGPAGHVIGVDMTPAMIARARDSARSAGLSQVEFREGRLEALPVADASIDAVTSNCVINLVPDKRAVFREIARVLRPGGRLVISDILLDAELPGPLARDLPAYVGCVAGAMRREPYFAEVRAAGLSEIEVLADVDVLARLDDALPPDVAALPAPFDAALRALQGQVRSVTFRARK